MLAASGTGHISSSCMGLQIAGRTSIMTEMHYDTNATMSPAIHATMICCASCFQAMQPLRKTDMHRGTHVQTDTCSLKGKKIREILSRVNYRLLLLHAGPAVWKQSLQHSALMCMSVSIQQSAWPHSHSGTLHTANLLKHSETLLTHGLVTAYRHLQPKLAQSFANAA